MKRTGDDMLLLQKSSALIALSTSSSTDEQLHKVEIAAAFGSRKVLLRE